MELSLAHPNGSAWTQEYRYDDARRLIGVASSAGEFDYAYDPVKLQRVDGLTLPNGAYITNTFDSVARLLSTALVSNSRTNLDSQNYLYNTAGQRTSETNAAGDHRAYTYDNEGELRTCRAFEPNGSTRSMDEALYVYDGAGNMISKEPGYNPYQLVSYTLNNLNEITNALTGGGLENSNDDSGSTSGKANGVAAMLSRGTPVCQAHKECYGAAGCGNALWGILIGTFVGCGGIPVMIATQ